MEQNNIPEKPEQEPQVEPTQVKITDVFAEEVNPVEDIESAEVDESDFMVSASGERKEEEQDPAPAEEKQQEKAEEKKVEPVKEKPLSKSDEDKNAAVRRMFNPETAMLMIDILAKRAGRMALPDRPDYLRMNEEDKADFKTLLFHTAQEENWSAIPTKYLLAVAGFFWLFGKIYKWNKPHLWDETEAGKLFVKKDAPADQEKKDAILEYIREKAKADAEQGNKELREMITALNDRAIKQDEAIENMLNILKGTAPAAAKPEINEEKISDVAFEDLPPEKIVDGYDMDIIEFTEGGSIIDKSKAGLPGFSEDGRKDGRRSKRDIEIHAHWKKYRAWKRKYLKVA